MATALVVDDSEIDRHRIAGLLREKAGLDVKLAGGAEEALVLLHEIDPDIVLTDLQMPGMDGLQLVDEIRRAHPAIPVVLMTAHGSEELAVEALRRGAASYVPKRLVHDDLASTVDTVIAASRARRQEDRAIGCLVESVHRFEMGNDPACFAGVIGLCKDQLRRRRFMDETGIVQVAMALTEALANALHHGNLEVDSALREQGFDAYLGEVERRRSTPPYADRRIRFTVGVSRTEARYVVSDDGPGFDPSRVPDPRRPENLAKASGRGLLLIRTFMDDVSFNGTGSEVRMVKRRA